MKNSNINSRLIAIAPMMKWSDRHCRYLFRLFSKNVYLYTEMVTTGAILYGDRQRLLAFDPIEHPIALQLGGSDPQELAQCAKIGVDYGYDEINLNVGCPSHRVQSGCFGAALMAQPQRVADAVAAMQAAVSLPVTVKTRIGIDQLDRYSDLCQFVRQVAAAGCHIFIIHARKAWLNGLSPKENREIPPLNYQRVYRLKRDFPHLTIIINGGITSCAEIDQHLTQVDGVMIGRQAYYYPAFLTELERYFDSNQIEQGRERLNQVSVVRQFCPYLAQQLACGVPLKSMARHLLSLFAGMPGAKQWRRYLSERMHRSGADVELIEQALQYILTYN